MLPDQRRAGCAARAPLSFRCRRQRSAAASRIACLGRRHDAFALPWAMRRHRSAALRTQCRDSNHRAAIPARWSPRCTRGSRSAHPARAQAAVQTHCRRAWLPAPASRQGRIQRVAALPRFLGIRSRRRTGAEQQRNDRMAALARLRRSCEAETPSRTIRKSPARRSPAPPRWHASHAPVPRSGSPRRPRRRRRRNIPIHW